MPAFVGERHKTKWIAQSIDGGENIIEEYGLWVGFERAILAFDLTKISGRKVVVVLPFTAAITVVESMRFCFQANYINGNILKTVKEACGGASFDLS